MKDRKEGLTRGEVIRGGLLRAAALSLLPVASSCSPERVASTPPPEPEEKLNVGYGEMGSFRPAFHTCRGLAVHGEAVWVAGDMAIQSYRNGAPAELHDLPGTAQAVAVGPDGTVFAALDDRVVRVGSHGAQAWDSLGPRARLVEIVATKEDVFVADAGNRQVVRYSWDGKAKSILGKPIPEQEYAGLIVPSPYLGIALLSSGELAVCNPGQHRIEVHSPEQGLIRSFGEPGQEIAAFCGCCNPMSLAVLESGDFVVAEKGIPRVKVLSPHGALKTVVAPPSAFDPKTTGLEVAVQKSRVLVLDPWQGAVRTFEPI